MNFALCFTTLLWKLGCKTIIIPLSIILYTLGVLGCAYYNVFQNAPVLGVFFQHSQFNSIRRILLMGFPFFVGGYLVLQIRNKISKIHGQVMWILSLLIWIIEIVIVVKLQLQQSIVLTFGLYCLVISILIVLLQNPCPRLNKIASTNRKLANFTYYVHPAFIMLITFVWGIVFSGQQAIPNTALFLLTVVVTLIVGLLICRFNIPILNKLIR